jgi:type VI secretion system VgrG family protein
MINLRFESRALPADTFQVLQFDGEEEISKLYHFELRLVSRDPDIDFESVLQSSAQLAITAQGNTRYLNGMLSEFEQRGQWQNGLYEYRAVLVPRLWIMAQSTQNQIFQEQTVPAIVESELSSIRDKGSHPLVRDGLSVDDYEIYTIRDYDECEYVVQYKETDHNFISRLMEHEGIYYYFEQDDIREKLVVTDAMATEEIGDDSYAIFQTEASASHYDSNVVYKLNRLQKQIPDSVLIKDFNYRSPSMPMQSDSLVDENGIGFVTEFGAHFKEPEQGQVLATLRAEEFRCRQNVYTGESNIAAMTCAGLYSLGQHFRREYNQTYMITRVRHSGSQEIESWGNVGSTRYNNEFDCIPSGIPYRPQRLTPKPKLYGIMNGTIDSELDTGRADIDELGRYKVMMPFDISGVGPGMGSRRIRMAQPYGGGGSGMSFPLIKGTEVIWTCIDGDIDRPIITGAVPNPLNPSVTNTDNANSNVIKTSSGITMGFHDGAGSGVPQNNTGGGAGSGLAGQQQYQKTDAYVHALQNNQVQSKHSELHNNSTSLPNRSNYQPIELQQQLQSGLSLDANYAFGKDIKETDANFQIGVPYGVKNSYLRMGSKANAELFAVPASATGPDTYLINDILNTSNHPWKTAGKDWGWVDFTDDSKASIMLGDSLTYTMGKRIDVIDGGDYDLIISSGDLETANAGYMAKSTYRKVGTFADQPVWRKTVVDHTCSDSYSYGDSESFFAGFTFEGFAGLATEVKVGGSFSATVGLSVEAYAGSKVSCAIGPDISYAVGGVDTEGTTNEMTGYTRSTVNVKPAINDMGKAKWAAAIGGVSSVVTTAIVAGMAIDSQDAGVGVGMGIATALTTGLTAVAIADKQGKFFQPPVAELDLKVSGARLGLGEETGPYVPPPLCGTGPGIDITPEGITIGFGPTGNHIKITMAGIELVCPTGFAKVHSNLFSVGANDVNWKVAGGIGFTSNFMTLKGTNFDSTFVSEKSN